MTGPLFRADAQMAALHLARVFDGRDPDPRRIRQWEGRIRVWAHRFPDRIDRFGHLCGDRFGYARWRTQYDLGQLEDLARELLGTPISPKP